jgi:hypothetical protein
LFCQWKINEWSYFLNVSRVLIKQHSFITRHSRWFNRFELLNSEVAYLTPKSFSITSYRTFCNWGCRTL